MSPKYSADLSTVSTGFPVLKPGEYEFQVGDPQSFKRLAGEDKHESYGIGVSLTVVEVIDGDATAKGKKPYRQFYMQNKEGWGFAKAFVMACLGYKNNDVDQQRFDNDVKGQDWSFNTDDKSVGEMWKKIRGTRVICAVELGQPDQSGNPTQKWLVSRPLGSEKK